MPKQRIKLTIKAVEGLPPAPAKQSAFYWDTEQKGLGVRVNDKGEKFFAVLVSVKGGDRHRVALGRYGHGLTLEQARTAAARYQSAARQGVDLYAQEKRAIEANAARLTLSQLSEKWLTDHVRPKRSARTAKDYDDYCRRYLIPKWGKRSPGDIAPHEVATFHADMSDKPKAANYAVVIGKALVNYGLEKGLIERGIENPFAGIELYDEEGRERYLTDDEIARVGTAIAELEDEGRLSPWTAGALRLLMLTGARSGEIKSLQWDFVDFERGLLNLPTSKTGKKSIFLSPAALTVLKAIPRVNGSPYVIVGQVEGQPLVTLRQAWQQVRDRTGLHDVRVHDLRHTFASVAASGGVSLQLIGKLLGHKVAATTSRYAHLTDRASREANATVGAVIAAALGDATASAEVIVMPKRRRGA